MGKPAARITDMHVCPKTNPGPVPHVGGPIAMGSPNVLIGSLPAARVGDMAICVGPPDKVSAGSSGVLINGKAAARLGDSTAHGGKIVVGCSTVLIGDGGGGGGSGVGGTDTNVKSTVKGGANVGDVGSGSKVPENFESVYAMAPAAKIEIDNMADEIAAKYGGKVAKAPIKSQNRAIEKINNDYGGDATRIKDLARNTIVVQPDKVDDVVGELAKRGANVKVIDGAKDPLGYSGVNSTVKTQTGLTAEIQVNTPAMIYAKEPESIARVMLGDDTYGSMAAKTTIKGGQGHKLYEQWRILGDADPQRSAIEYQSKAYYNSVRKAFSGN